MEVDKIVGIVVLTVCLVALLVLLYFAVISTMKTELEERKCRIKMYKTITNYLENKQKD